MARGHEIRDRLYIREPNLELGRGKISYSRKANTSIMPLNDVKVAAEYIMCLMRALNTSHNSFHIVKGNDPSGALGWPVQIIPYESCRHVVNITSNPKSKCCPTLPFS